MSGETVAGRYRLLEPLGRGPMSSVWLAHDDELQRRVAVKMLGVAADPARFEREARAAAALSHPNIAALYDYGEDRNRPYMVLEYLGNGSLEDRLRSEAPLPDAETLRIAVEIAAGLAHAHERGLVHRDLKPANVLFDAEQRAKIADFGIARMGDSGTLTEAGTVLGTASYISPEQAAGKPAGPQSDVYSFGVMLFRMLTGELPFVSTNAMELVRRHRDEQPPRVHDIRPEANARLAAIADACLAKDPAHRPADGEALLAELRGTDATTVTQVLRPPPSRRSKQWLIPVIALVAVLLGGGITLAILTTGGSGSGGPTAPTTQLTLPTVKTTESTPTTTAATTEPTTTASTTAPTTTATPTTTAARPTTTAVVPPPPLPTTTVELPTTTAAAPTTTETTPTTTEELPTTTTDTTTTTP
jgi:eukaryotic-like serine/threonine-protein kinase